MKTLPLRRAAAAGILTALALSMPVGAWAEEDPNLDQTIESDQPVVTGQAVLSAGHVDMGPRFIDGEWTFLIHDDVAKAEPGGQSVWRYPDETAFHIVDAGQLPVPDDAAYSFIDAPAGDPVWLSPQTQNPDVVWLGWNTQAPDVMAQIDRGITLTYHGIEGPGELAVFLQSGSFGEPQVLWDSTVEGAQPIWVDVNTHTHANWVFTEPGTYLVQIEASADLIDGTSVTDTQVLRVAVGTDTDPAEVLAASWSGPEVVTSETDESTDAAAPASAADPLVPLLGGIIGVVTLALVAAFTIVIVRGNRARRQVLASGQGGEATDD